MTVLGSAIRSEGAWDTGFGGEIALGAMQDGVLGAWAAGVGVLAFSERAGGRISAEAAVGTRWPLGLLIGVAGGPLVELDEARHPRLGGDLSIWAYAGIAPYIRIGAVEKSGAFLDIGLRIPLPAGRW